MDDVRVLWQFPVSFSYRRKKFLPGGPSSPKYRQFSAIPRFFDGATLLEFDNKILNIDTNNQFNSVHGLVPSYEFGIRGLYKKIKIDLKYNEKYFFISNKKIV